MLVRMCNGANGFTGEQMIEQQILFHLAEWFKRDFRYFIHRSQSRSDEVLWNKLNNYYSVYVDVLPKVINLNRPMEEVKAAFAEYSKCYRAVENGEWSAYKVSLTAYEEEKAGEFVGFLYEFARNLDFEKFNEGYLSKHGLSAGWSRELVLDENRDEIQKQFWKAWRQRKKQIA